MKETMIGCNRCGKALSEKIQVPNDFKIVGWIECTDCIHDGMLNAAEISTEIIRTLTGHEFKKADPVRRGSMIEDLSFKIAGLQKTKRLAVKKSQRNNKSLFIPTSNSLR